MLFLFKKYKQKENDRFQKIYNELNTEKEIAKKNKLKASKILEIETKTQYYFYKIKVDLANLNFTYQEICTL